MIGIKTFWDLFFEESGLLEEDLKPAVLAATGFELRGSLVDSNDR